jgi:hypothetical protein
MIELEARAALRVPLHQVKAEASLALLGQQAGAMWAIERVQSLDVEREQEEQLVPTWGSEDVLKELGLTKEK